MTIGSRHTVLAVQSQGFPGAAPTVCLDCGLVRLRAGLGVPPDVAWGALTSSAGMASWLGRVEGDGPGPGSQFVVWHDGQTASSHRVTEWVVPSAFGMTWDFPGEAASRVSFRLSPAARGCVLDLRHEAVEEPVEYAAGWHRHLEYLAAAVAGRVMPANGFWDGHDERVAQYAAAAVHGCDGTAGGGCHHDGR